MIVSFVNLKRGHAAQTSCMLATAIMLALEEQKRILLIHTGIKSWSLERALLGKNEAEIGIDELKRAFMQKKLSEAEIITYCHPFLEGKLFLLSGTKAENEVMFEEIMQQLFPLLLPELQQWFDYIFIDIENNSSMADILIDMSGQVVITASQNPAELKQAVRLSESKEKLKPFWILGRYDKKSCFDFGYVRRKATGGNGKRLGTIAYCSGFMDAMFKGRVIEFFKINIKATVKDINYEFIKSLRETKNKLLTALKGDEDEERRRD